MGIRRFFATGSRAARGSAREWTPPGEPEPLDKTVDRLCERVEALEDDVRSLAIALSAEFSGTGGRVKDRIHHRQRHDDLSAEDAYAAEIAEGG